ncbi:hypothetical protein DT383_06580 [Pseudomonas aeruginosa]|nr:hypothetical protein LT17_01593 [Pseudomonas aeruginosa]RCI67560.1 hypothetical protein DT383_06580 [Pseudomonas aeruginosa]RTR71521.1 hypothetical protein DY930_21220 [Pseudomonas aeruginosa]
MAASTAGTNGLATPVEVDGVRYPSARQAAFALGLPTSTVQRRTNNPNFPTYRWLGATPGKRQVRTPEDCEVAKPLVEPAYWAFNGDLARRASVMDPNEEPPRVVRRVGYVRCLCCGRPHFSPDVVRARMCSACGGAGGWPIGADPDENT